MKNPVLHKNLHKGPRKGRGPLQRFLEGTALSKNYLKDRNLPWTFTKGRNGTFPKDIVMDRMGVRVKIAGLEL